MKYSNMYKLKEKIRHKYIELSMNFELFKKMLSNY